MPNTSNAHRLPPVTQSIEPARLRLAVIALVAAMIIAGGAILAAANRAPDSAGARAIDRPPSGTRPPTSS